MSSQDLQSMLGRLPGIQHACDVDLLLFFYRHPCALMTGERLVACLGYDRGQAVKSLEMLIEAGFVTRSQNPCRTARMYVLNLEALPDGLLSRFLDVASTRQGRQAVLGLLKSAPSARVHRRRASIARVA